MAFQWITPLILHLSFCLWVCLCICLIYVYSNYNVIVLSAIWHLMKKNEMIIKRKKINVHIGWTFTEGMAETCFESDPCFKTGVKWSLQRNLLYLNSLKTIPYFKVQLDRCSIQCQDWMSVCGRVPYLLQDT